MLGKIKKCCSLTNILKLVGLLIVLLFLGGIIAGFVNIQQAMKERNDISAINSMLENQGLTNDAKTAISKFMKNYSGTKNIIICDNKGTIIFKANDQFVKGKTAFYISKDDQHPGMYRMNRGPQRFMPMPKKEIFSLIPQINDQTVRGFNSNFQRKNVLDSFGGKRRNNPDFINSFNIPGKDMRIYYISGRFEENKMFDMFFVSHQILRFLILIFWLLLAIWVYKDSKTRGLQQIFWGLFTLFTGLIGLIVYLLITHRMNFCGNCKIKVERDANYCYECGSILRTKCSSCGNMMNLEWNHCTTCGKKKDEA